MALPTWQNLNAKPETRSNPSELSLFLAVEPPPPARAVNLVFEELNALPSCGG